jgi:nitroimidazol reductase NimA-like FMN-containing flavoprotein (pyridoxamine 5'-phosphate oxidase superfamily)
MFTTTTRDFLKKPLIARMSTIDPAGYPHTVPVWFMLDGDDIVIISDRNTRKVGHLHSNPKGAVTVGGDQADGEGYLVKGRFTVEPDPGGVWVRRFVYHYESPEQAEKDLVAWADLDLVVLRLCPEVVLKVM